MALKDSTSREFCGCFWRAEHTFHLLLFNFPAFWCKSFFILSILFNYRSGLHSSMASLDRFSLNAGVSACITWWVLGIFILWRDHFAPPPDPLFDTKQFSSGTPQVILFLPECGIYFLKNFFVIYDQMSSLYSLCAPSYALNVKE